MYRRIDGLLGKQSSSRILLGLARLISPDRRRKANFLAYLNEVDERRLYASEGYSSLFRFLTERHRISESSALKRIQAAKLCRKFPFLYRDVAEGKFSLSALSRLSPFVNGSNSHLLFPECRGKSVREVENALVKRFPKADVEEKLQKSVSALGKDRIKVQFMTDEAFQKDFEAVRALSPSSS